MPAHAPIAFERFMERALYDPEHGYYSRRITGVGRRGDFTTSAMVSDAPAKAVAAWAARALDETQTRDLIEIGPGEGSLALAVLKNLPWRLRLRVRLHLVERSRPLAAIQQRLLGSRARWHETPADALKACSGKAVIFSNELVDAFPARRFEKSPDGWRELAVAFDSSGIPSESLMPPAPLPDSSVFSRPHPMHQRVEVHESYRRWLENWMPLWKAGKMLTIDYGSSAGRKRTGRGGTVRGYLLQQRIEGMDIYQNEGRQDLTADVDFTDLIDWSGKWTEKSELQEFSAFLKKSIDPANAADQALADPRGAGGAFLVLDQQCRRKHSQSL